MTRRQTWGIDHLPRKIVPVSDHPPSKEMPPVSSLNLPMCSFEPFPSVPSLGTGRRDPHPSSLLLLRKLEKAMESPLSLLFSSKVDLNCSLQLFNPHTSLSDLWTHSRTFTSFLNYGAQNSREYSRFLCLCLLGFFPIQSNKGVNF